MLHFELWTCGSLKSSMLIMVKLKLRMVNYNIPSFDLTLMGITPISYVVNWMFYFVYWALDPTKHEHDGLFDILGIS